MQPRSQARDDNRFDQGRAGRTHCKPPRLPSASHCVARRPQHQRRSHHAHQQTQSANCFMRLGLNHSQDHPWDAATRKTPCDRRLPCPAPPHRPSCVFAACPAPGQRCAGRRAIPLCRARSLCKNQICPSGGIRDDDDDDLELWYDLPRNTIAHLKMTTPKYRVRQVAHDDDVQGSSMGGP